MPVPGQIGTTLSVGGTRRNLLLHWRRMFYWVELVCYTSIATEETHKITINHPFCSFRPFSRRLLLLPPPPPPQSNQTTLSTPPLPLHIVTSCPDMRVLDKAMLAALPQRLLRTDRNDRKFEQWRWRWHSTESRQRILNDTHQSWHKASWLIQSHTQIVPNENTVWETGHVNL